MSNEKKHKCSKWGFITTPTIALLYSAFQDIMSFRKRNVALGSNKPNAPSAAGDNIPSTPAGVRPSPVDGRPTTSTGTQNLDDLLGGHAGFPLGNSILIEENGTTDFAGALLRFYAAEGIVQGHQVHVVGVDEEWGRELPGLTSLPTKERGAEQASVEKEKMKIAWRYERLGEFGTGKENSRRKPGPPTRPPFEEHILILFFQHPPPQTANHPTSPHPSPPKLLSPNLLPSSPTHLTSQNASPHPPPHSE